MSSLSVLEGLEEALDEAARTLDPAADLVVAFAAPTYPAAALVEGLRERFTSATIVGSTASGVVGGGREVERQPALSLTAATLPGVRLTWVDAASPSVPADAAGVLLLTEPFAAVEEILAAFDAATDAPVFGGIASGGRARGDFRLFQDDTIVRGGAIALAFSGDVHIDTLVAQGCKPVGEPLLVVRSSKNTILELDRGLPAEVLRDLSSLLSPEDQRLMRNALFIGIQMRDQSDVYEQGDFLVRNLLGVDPKRRSLSVAAVIEGHPVVQFHVRDAAASRADLVRHLAARRGEAEGALMFSCLGRGVGLYGEPDHDSDLIGAAWFADRPKPSAPLGGFFCNGEIGPVGGRTFLHGYTSSVARFSSKGGGQPPT